MKTIQMNVPGMQSNHCQLRVKTVVSNIKGVELNQVTPGQVNLKVESESVQAEVINAIVNAGYEVEKVNTLDTETMKFKTNINCSGCIAQVTPSLNNTVGVCDWNVDTNSPDKVLTVQYQGITEEEIMAKVKGAGFNIQKLS